MVNRTDDPTICVKFEYLIEVALSSQKAKKVHFSLRKGPAPTDPDDLHNAGRLSEELLRGRRTIPGNT